MQLFDSHAHPHFAAYGEDSDEVIQRALDSGVNMLAVGTHLNTSKNTIECAEKYDGVWASIGLHPVHVTDGYFDPNEDPSPSEKTIAMVNDFKAPTFQRRAEVYDVEAYRALAGSSKKVVAIGECGLDYYRLEGSDKEKEKIKVQQRAIFEQQAQLAAELDLALVVHCREAHDDVFEILKSTKEKYPQLRGVIHCFTGTPEEARRHLSLGFYISFSGIITFAHDWDEFISETPLTHLLVETDCPYLTPVPYRGKRNEPAFVEHTVRHMAKLKGTTFEEVARVTCQNALALFQIKLDGSKTGD
jgi:TatD DNase family protein